VSGRITPSQVTPNRMAIDDRLTLLETRVRDMGETMDSINTEEWIDDVNIIYERLEELEQAAREREYRRREKKKKHETMEAMQQRMKAMEARAVALEERAKKAEEDLAKHLQLVQELPDKITKTFAASVSIDLAEKLWSDFQVTPKPRE